MSFTQGIQKINGLVADQAVASSIVPIDIGSTGAGNSAFSVALLTGNRIKWRLEGLFSLGATGGFRLLAHNTSAPTAYNAVYQIIDLTTPTTFNAGQVTEAAFANAAAVASNYSLRAFGSVIANAATTFSLQFAQNTSDVLPITMLKGLTFQVWQF